MTETVEARFKTAPAPYAVEWLSDNGPGYVAYETVALSRELGLKLRTTPTYRPESNGMAEAFVKTFKRDYVYLNNLESAAKVMGQLNGWFEDYNKMAPQNGLKLMSPRQCRRLASAEKEDLTAC